MFLPPAQLKYRYTQTIVVRPSTAQPVNTKLGLWFGAFVYHLASTRLQLPQNNTLHRLAEYFGIQYTWNSIVQLVSLHSTCNGYAYS